MEYILFFAALAAALALAARRLVLKRRLKIAVIGERAVIERALQRMLSVKRSFFLDIGHPDTYQPGLEHLNLWPKEGGKFHLERRRVGKRFRYSVQSGLNQDHFRSFPPEDTSCEEAWFTGPVEALFERYGTPTPVNEMDEYRAFIYARDHRSR